MKTNIGLSEEQRKGVAQVLSGALADLALLYTKTRNYHWNVTGPHFSELHKLFEGQYEALAEASDQVAERIRSMGARAPGALAQFLKLTRLSEENAGVSSARDMIANLLADHEAIIRQLREDIDTCDEKYKDTGTADFLTGLMEDHEKTAWMLRVHLQEG